MTEITSVFQGVTTPPADLIKEIERQGWELEKLEFKNGVYYARAKAPGQQKVERTGRTDSTALGSILVAITRKTYMRSAAQVKIGMWDTNFTDQLQDVAAAYAKAPVYDPKAAPAWKELAQDSVHRAQILGQQIQIEIVDDPDPYGSPQEMFDDIHNKKHFLVSRANSQHPIWSADENVAFRTVHDILGHAVSGGDFGWTGENKACAAHFPLLTPPAQKALFTECIGQTAYAAFYRGFGPQKVCFLDEYIQPAQQTENPANHWGVHPSQSVAPSGTPQIEPSAAVGMPGGNVPPHMEPAVGPIPLYAKRAAAGLQDPNAGYETGANPLPNNAYMWHGDPLQANFEDGNLMDMGHRLDTNWAQKSEAEAKQAVVNAFRVALLSPRKNLRWNAIHYQDISQVPAEVDDPAAYWNALEDRRVSWNVARGRHPEAHITYYKDRQIYYQILRFQHPKLTNRDIHELADEHIRSWKIDAEQKIEAEEDRKMLAPDKRMSADDLERAVNKEIGRQLKAIIKSARGDMHDVPNPDNQMTMEAGLPGQVNLRGEIMPDDMSAYGAFMGGHMKSIARISKHVDEILQAALEDVHEHDGKGHHFRAAALQLGIPGVGPKVASFAWLLLQPMTSQLATIDTHMMNVLGHKYEDKMSPRDYFKFERELQAGRDASGYGHVPLGMFQWGMWDAKRTGMGTHQDHSSMKVLNPTPHNQIDWNGPAPTGEDWTKAPPQWWGDTAPYREAVADDWDRTVAPNFPKTQLPFPTTGKIAKRSNQNPPTPWFRDEQGNQVSGNSGGTLMQHLRDHFGLSTPEIWAMDVEAGKHHAADA